MDRRRVGFDKYSLEARKIANCVLCPRGFENRVCLMWTSLPVCQSCFIRKMGEENERINNIQSQQLRHSRREGEQISNTSHISESAASLPADIHSQDGPNRKADNATTPAYLHPDTQIMRQGTNSNTTCDAIQKGQFKPFCPSPGDIHGLGGMG